MSFNTRSREVTLTLFEVCLDGEWFKVSDVVYVLQGLEDTGFMEHVVIDDSKLARALEARKVAFRGTRGSYRRDKEWDEFYRALRTLEDAETRRLDEEYARRRAEQAAALAKLEGRST